MYVTVIIAQNLPYKLTYHVPSELESDILVGLLVVLPSGNNKVNSGIISNILSDEESKDFNIKMKSKKSVVKDILSITSPFPIVTENQLKLWQWIASYYICSEGDVMRYFIPKELIIKGSVSGDSITYRKSKSIVNEKIVSLSDRYSTDSEIGTLLDNLKRSKKQYLMLLYFLENRDKFGSITVKDLYKGEFNSTHLLKAINNGIFTIKEEPKFANNIKNSENILSQSCDDVSIPVLMHSSRREENIDKYIELIKKNLEEDKTVLVLLTREDKDDIITQKIIDHFGNSVIKYFSNYRASIKYKNYCSTLNGSGKVLIGNSASLGLPFINLSLVIVIDEHSLSYKLDSSPHIQTRDAALMLARFNGSNIILDSFCPSIESYYNAKIGKYKLTSSVEKIDSKITPISKYSIASKDRYIYGNIPQVRYFSKYLLEKMNKTILSGGRVLLFHNRRGYNSYLECKDCGDVVKCKDCNVSMRYHKEKNCYMCHYCGMKIQPINQCQSCNSKNLQLKGIGSENIEESIKKHFPKANVLRLDSDILEKRENRETAKRILDNNEADIIVGTLLTIPFTAKSDISLIGIIDADTLFNIPDFRAEERAFQVIKLLSNRVVDGETIIQCSNINSDIMNDIVSDSYTSMFNREVTTRQKFDYPPFVRNTRITIKDYSEKIAFEKASKLMEDIVCQTGVAVIGPEAPIVDKIRKQYIFNLTIKFQKTINNEKIKHKISEIINKSKLSATIDVDFI